MHAQNCECDDCCEGTQKLTPVSVANRPGLSALNYRVGTHAAFLETMKARLSTMTVSTESGATDNPLSALTTRLANDPSLALLDGWATIADVLTFYQERIANEGFLRTATERRSILELARLVGYAMRPGVSASVFLALDLDKNRSVVIQPGDLKAQSVPGPGEMPQTFETSDPTETRAEWNNLQVRVTKPQKITLENALVINRVYFTGATLNLKPSDRILFVFGDETGQQVVRRVKEAKAQPADNRTQVDLQEVLFLVIAGLALMVAALKALELEFSKLKASHNTTPLPATISAVHDVLLQEIANIRLGNYPQINAQLFSHDRLYDFLASITGVANKAAVYAGAQASPASFVNTASFERVARVFRSAADTGTSDAPAAMASAAATIDPFVGVYVNVIAAVLDEAIQILQVTAFRHELICLVSTVIEQARPKTFTDQAILSQFLPILDDNQFGSIRKLFSRFVPSAVYDSSVLGSKLNSLGQAFTRLAGTANIYDALSDLLDDLNNLPGDYNSKTVQNVLAWLATVPKGYAIRCEPAIATTSPDELISPLALLPSLQPASSARLARSIQTTFGKGADTIPKVALSLTPRLRETYYLAWANAVVNSAAPDLKSVHVLRAEAVPFGYNAPVKMALKPNNDPNLPYISQPDGDWSPTEASDESPETLYLDAANTAILPQSYVLIQNKNNNTVLALVNATITRPRTAYSMSSKTTQLTLSRSWWHPASDSMSKIRETVIAAQSEQLTLAEKPMTTDVQGDTIELNAVYKGLTSGRWLFVSGERSDIENTSGVLANELVMLAGVDQEYDDNLPGDTTHTVLTLANALAYRYKRASLVIHGNVLKATHGETRKEMLGSGDASQAFQTFALKQAPLTFVSSPTPAGAESTLAVYVNDVKWHEADTMAGLAATDRKFITKTDDTGKTTVIFGNGKNGARLPTAPANIRAEYRSGIGRGGNVQPGQISMLTAKPLGVNAVNNPLRASGGADRESRDTARKNAPRTVNALDRLVSVTDYADFARTFAGIGKSTSAQISNHKRQLVHVSIAGADDIPIDETSDLFHNLLAALRAYGDPDLAVTVQVRELLLLVISANVRILPDYQWDPVASAIRANLLDIFSFERRELGQDVFLSEVIAAIQSVRGVDYVDVDVLGGLPEKKSDKDQQGQPVRRLLTPQEIAKEAATFISHSTKTSRPRAYLPVNLAGFEKGAMRPAQLAYLTPDVIDTLVLNQVK